MFNKKGGKICPMLKKPCIEHECMWYIQLRGTHPQTGEPVDSFDCTMVVQPLLMIENSNQQRKTGAAIESFRNETIKSNFTTQQLLLEAANTNNNSTLLIREANK